MDHETPGQDDTGADTDGWVRRVLAAYSEILDTARDYIGLGYDAFVTDEHSRRRVTLEGIRGVGKDAEKLAGFLTAHPMPDLAVASSWGPSVLGLEVYGEEAITFVAEAVRALGPAPYCESASPVRMRTYLLAFPPGAVVLAESLDPSGLIRVLGVNAMIPVPFPGDAFQWIWPSGPVGSLPIIPPAIQALFPDAWIRVGLSPYFREYGRTTGYYPWWWLDELIVRDDPARPFGPDFVGTVSRHVGPGLSTDHVCDLLLECDYEEDDAVARSIAAAKGFVERLRQLGVPDHLIRVRYSGGKSIHVEVGWRCFGQVPRPDAREVMAQFAERYFADVADFDRYLYRPRQKARLPATLHTTSKRYCTPITLDELFQATAEGLMARAMQPPTWFPPPATSDVRVDALAKLFEETAADEEWREAPPAPSTGPTAAAGTPGARKRTAGQPAVDRRRARRILQTMPDHPPCIRALITDARTKPGFRNVLAVALAAYLVTRDVDEVAERRLVKEASRNITSLHFDPAGVEESVLDALGIARASRPGTYVFQGTSSWT